MSDSPSDKLDECYCVIRDILNSIVLDDYAREELERAKDIVDEMGEYLRDLEVGKDD